MTGSPSLSRTVPVIFFLTSAEIPPTFPEMCTSAYTLDMEYPELKNTDSNTVSRFVHNIKI